MRGQRPDSVANGTLSARCATRSVRARRRYLGGTADPTTLRVDGGTRRSGSLSELQSTGAILPRRRFAARYRHQSIAVMTLSRRVRSQHQMPSVELESRLARCIT